MLPGPSNNTNCQYYTFHRRTYVAHTVPIVTFLNSLILILRSLKVIILPLPYIMGMANWEFYRFITASGL